MNEPTCGCCGATEADVLRGGLRAPLPGWTKHCGLPEIMCGDCFFEWYGDGVTDPDEITERSCGGSAASRSRPRR